MVCQYNFVSRTTEMQCPALSTSKLCFGLLAFLYSCFFETVIGLLSHTLVYPQSFFRGCIDGEAVTEDESLQEYIEAINKAFDETTTSNKTPDTGDNANLLGYSALLVVEFAVVVFMKRKIS